MGRIIFKHVLYNFLSQEQSILQISSMFSSRPFFIYWRHHSIVKSIDDGKSFCMVFSDLSKAFDRI